MKVDEVLKCLNAALRLQHRSIIQFTLAAGAMTGLENQYVADRLTSFAEGELDDARRLVEKIVALDGEPTAEVASPRFDADPRAALSALVETETEAVEAIQRVIEPAGNEAPGEALEHLAEHLILRKQNQIDFLIRARGR